MKNRTGRDRPGRRIRTVIVNIVLGGVFLSVATAPASAQSTSDSLIADRFRVSIEWRDHSGRTGEGFPVLSSEKRRSAVFAFFDADNWELMVKVLDGCAINGHYWVFASASTDVEYTLEIDDLDSGLSVSYSNPLATRAAAITDTTALASCETGGEAFRLRRVLEPSQLTDYLKLGLENLYGGSHPYPFGPSAGGPTGGPSGEPGDGGGGGGGLTQTNVQEEGVDEADRVKSDGDFLYVLRNYPSPSFEGGAGSQIRVFDVDQDEPSASKLRDFDLTLDESQQARGLYLRPEQKRLIVTTSSGSFSWFDWYSPLAYLNGKTSVVSVDVSTPASPAQGTTLEVDGELISSRRIDSTVYVATRFHPSIPDLQFFNPEDPRSALPELERIDAATLSDLMPEYRHVRDGAVIGGNRSLVDPGDCYLPADGSPIRSADIITVVAVDLDTMSISSTVCFVGASETLYVSLDSLYLASTRAQYTLGFGGQGPSVVYRDPMIETDLHKFDLADGQIRYRGSGVVDGHLGWNLARKPFRLSERGDDLRAITYTAELTEDSSPVAVTVLRDEGNLVLEQIGRIPSEQRPAPIGKPGEELYATRFVGDLAYLVTFRATDPLYVVDLSTPEDPQVAGELEIDGYSEYLHPVEGGYLIGVGKDAIPADSGGFRGAWYQGVKVALYDVNDPANPQEIDAIVLGNRGTEAAVLWDHHAFTFSPGDEGRPPRFALGATVNKRELSPSPSPGPWPWTAYGWSYSGLHAFEVETAAGRLVDQGALVVEEYAPDKPRPTIPHWSPDDRSLLGDEAVFYLHGDDVYSTAWSELQPPP